MSLYFLDIEILLNMICHDCVDSYFCFVMTPLKENDSRSLFSKGILPSTYWLRHSILCKRAVRPCIAHSVCVIVQLIRKDCKSSFNNCQLITFALVRNRRLLLRQLEQLLLRKCHGRKTFQYYCSQLHSKQTNKQKKPSTSNKIKIEKQTCGNGKLFAGYQPNDCRSQQSCGLGCKTLLKSHMNLKIMNLFWNVDHFSVFLR